MPMSCMARGDDIQPVAQPPEQSLAIEMQPMTDDSPGAEVEPEATEYPRGLQFALISSSLCLCVFLVGLVSRPHLNEPQRVYSHLW